MREHVSHSKKATNASFSIPTLRHRIPGFGSDSSQASPQAVPLVQPLNKPLTHDISRMSLRRPQAKLSISQPGDVYEQEADSVAQQVMQTISEPVSKQSLQREELQMKSLDSSTLQREEAPEDEEELMLKEINPQNHPVQPIQAKLTIGEPGDKYEQEADRVASQVVQQINTPSAAQSTQGKSLQRQDTAEEEIQTKPSISVLQRSPIPTQVELEAIPGDEELQAKSILQGRDARGSGEASTDVESAINSARGGGMPLDARLQQSIGQAMGADFSGVKVHTDSQADQLNQSIQAKAFTTGQDVFFRSGEYNPGSRGGQELIAHELTHVVQQNENHLSKSSLPRKFHISSIYQPTIQGVFTTAYSLNGHYLKHVTNNNDAGGAYADEAAYEAAADAIVADPNSLSKPRGDGQGMYYLNQTTGQFVTTDATGKIRTMFVPGTDPNVYYNGQI